MLPACLNHLRLSYPTLLLQTSLMKTGTVRFTTKRRRTFHQILSTSSSVLVLACDNSSECPAHFFVCVGGLHASPHVQAFGYHLPSAQLGRNRSNVAIFNCCNPRTSLVDDDWSNSALLVAFLHDAAPPSHVRLCSTRCPSWLARQSESSAVQRKLHVRQCQHSDRTFAPSSLGVLFGPSTILRPHKATFESRSATPGKRER